MTVKSSHTFGRRLESSARWHGITSSGVDWAPLSAMRQQPLLIASLRGRVGSLTHARSEGPIQCPLEYYFFWSVGR
eukprot:168688-Pyramimonas_sp.AAC.1